MKTYTLLLLRRGDEVLLAMKKRGFGVGKWNGVGGKVEAGETVEQALVRECQEEIGVTPISYQPVAVLDFTFPNGSQQHVRVFVCAAWEGQPTESEEMAPQWYRLAEIPYDHMWSDDPLWLPEVLAGKLLKGAFRFDDHDQMLDQKVTIVNSLED